MSRRDDWPDVRAHIVTEFNGEQPGNQLEAELIDLYETNPTAVLNAVPSIAKSLNEGSINSGWAVLRKAAATKATTPPGQTVAREKLIRNAEQWIRNAGLMYDRWTEVEDELFGDRGQLAPWKTSTKLTDRTRETWEAVRPSGIATEEAETERAERWQEQQAALAKLPKQTIAPVLRALPHPAPDADLAYLASLEPGYSE